MHEPQDARPRARSPFTAAFLSLLFPGLGQLYAGAPSRALAFAAAPVLLLALALGIGLRMNRLELVGLVLNPFVLTSVFVLNLGLLVYRFIAIVDAYRVAEYMNAYAASGDGRAGRASLRRNPLSIAGLLAVLLVMAGSHVVVARYDVLALDVLNSGCIFVGNTSGNDCEADATPSPGGSVDANDPSAEPTDSPTPEATPVGSDVPSVTIPPWDGVERLNILLIGSDEQGGGHNTDTLITVSIDPLTRQVAMFGLPRDTVDVPVPAGPARRLWGSVYANRINSFFVNNRKRSDLWPGGDRLRGYNALKATLGELYGLDIKYFVEVNFEGFKSVVDAMGGVTINVQIPVLDDRFPAERGRLVRVYIPSGIQHMDGTQALRYARSRKNSAGGDYDRAARQQRVLLSLREQADPAVLIPRLPELVSALKKTVRTDIPIDQLDELLGLASSIDTKDLRSYVFSPSAGYGQDIVRNGADVLLPNVPKIRAAVKNAFKVDPELATLRDAHVGEGAGVWVLNGTATSGRGTKLASYLEYYGLAASAPRQKPEGAVPADTTIVVYNGAEASLPATIAYLETTFGVTVSTRTDSAIRTDIVITIGKATPDLAAPSGP